ncbi:Glycosyl transferase, family 2 [Nitrospina gracilis 3/211]|uniref:Glycosyl transferase, family 2 n=1 Tax=Nitrospina gracilis (strain 3/211) TaxID=1266370 RepID=M1YKP1_NITG3|nr:MULTISPECIES: TIGR04283 family arsenosugar biosynthesis glycosyltransferase [Nitrospina]MCF8723941.1 rSAM/selenodomain-associated transferase 2 [Nitrospina sp. Nb-3]CCQ91064.1 Glycosyl transferase, family 2 [Nitrospina gracilis 3/211]
MNVSVIIPTWNESRLLPDTLERLTRISPYEILIGDGGSDDDTRSIAERHGVRCIESPRGRAPQMNAAAKEAQGNLLLFLHADSHLDETGFQRMVAVMQRGRHIGGAFSLAIDSQRPALQTISRLATLRSRYLNLVYGDQGIFVLPEVFHELGGFSPLPICEDLDFFRRLKKRGRTVILREAVSTSARRWHAEGLIWTTSRNILIASLFLMGFSPTRLSKWYPPKR